MPPEIFTCVGEGRAAHTDDTGILHDLHHFLHRQSVGIGRSLHLFADRVLEIVFDHHGHHVAAHRKGRGSMAFTVPETLAWIGAPSAMEFADFLTHLYLVAYFYDRGAGCAKVHRHGDDHGSRGVPAARWPFHWLRPSYHGDERRQRKLVPLSSPHSYSIDRCQSIPRPAIGQWHGRPCFGTLSHTALYSTPPVEKCPDYEFVFCIKFINFFVFLHFFPVFAQAHPLFLVNLHIFLPTTPAVAVPPSASLVFFSEVCYDEAYLSESIAAVRPVCRSGEWRTFYDETH